VLLEAQEMAVRDHNVEYKSNLWVGMYNQPTTGCVNHTFGVRIMG